MYICFVNAYLDISIFQFEVFFDTLGFWDFFFHCISLHHHAFVYIFSTVNYVYLAEQRCCR